MTDKEKFLKCAEEVGIRTASYSITRISDYLQAVKFFECLRKGHVKLGMDMASLTCSGDVEIVGAQIKRICLIENDNSIDDYFKFKDMLLINGDINDPESSPEIFIEADEDRDWLKVYGEHGFQYIQKGRYLALKNKLDDTIIYDEKTINDYLNLEQEAYYNPNVFVPPFRRQIFNTKGELLVYINVQECHKRHKGNKILFHARDTTCDDLTNAFQKKYKLI